MFHEERTLQQKIRLTLFIVTPFALGVLVRVAVRNFQAADLSVEAAILLGVIGGRVAGATGGAILGLVVSQNGELAALPFDMLVGFVGGMLRGAAPRTGSGPSSCSWTAADRRPTSQSAAPPVYRQTLFFLSPGSTQLARMQLAGVGTAPLLLSFLLLTGPRH